MSFSQATIGKLVVIALVCPAAVSCSGPRPATDAQPDRIFLISVDTLRADHLGAYGYPRPTSPFLDRLATRGVVFRRAICSMATTLPSLSSMFTALHPLQHRVLKNGHRLGDEYVTMAERLRSQGFATAAVVPTGGHYRATNLGQGFDHFDEPNTQGVEYRQAESMVDAAISWLQQRRQQDRLFLWVHFADPHQPLIPPSQFVDKVACQNDEERQALVRFLLDEHRVDFGFFDHQEEELVELITKYDAEVRSVDEAVRKLFEWVDQQGMNHDSLWIVVSDHGEGLGNHQWLEHGKHIYNEQVRVPLIFWFSSGEPGGLAVDRIVETVDLLPTVLELVGVGLEDQIKDVQGTSLVPLFGTGGRGDGPGRLAFSQRRAYRQDVRVDAGGKGAKNYEKGNKYSLQNERFKYIHRTHGEDEFYVLDDDPYEVNNLAGSASEEEVLLREALIERISGLENGNPETPVSIDDENIERLRAMGYVQ